MTLFVKTPRFECCAKRMDAEYDEPRFLVHPLSRNWLRQGEPARKSTCIGIENSKPSGLPSFLHTDVVTVTAAMAFGLPGVERPERSPAGPALHLSAADCVASPVLWHDSQRRLV